MSSDFSFQYCVPPEYHFLMVELYYNDDHWAELNTEHGSLQVLFFSRPSGEPWAIPLANVVNALCIAESEIKRRSVFFEDQPTC